MFGEVDLSPTGDIKQLLLLDCSEYVPLLIIEVNGFAVLKELLNVYFLCILYSLP